jgi:hypothetical protein
MLRALGRGSAQSSSSGELLALGKELMAGARAMGSARSLQAAGVGRSQTDAGSAAPDPILALFARPVKQGLGAER